MFSNSETRFDYEVDFRAVSSNEIERRSAMWEKHGEKGVVGCSFSHLLCVSSAPDVERENAIV